MTAIDTGGKFGKDYNAAWLQQSGIDTVLRYISSGDQTKCIDAVELQSFMANRIKIGIIYELWGGSKGLPGSIDAANGTADGDYALRTLQALSVPENVVVYFAVDTSVDTNADINTYVVPYFQAAKQARRLLSHRRVWLRLDLRRRTQCRQLRQGFACQRDNVGRIQYLPRQRPGGDRPGAWSQIVRS